MESQMKIIVAIAMTTCFMSCSTVNDTVDRVHYGKKSEAPMPTEPLQAYGAHSTKGGSYREAREEAVEFCKRWRAAPTTLGKVVKYQGAIEEDTNTAIKVTTDVVRAVGAYLPNMSNNDEYETTLTYKCY